MSLLVSDLRLRWRSLLWWTVGVVLLSTLVASFYKSIAGDTAYEEVFSSLPESLQGLIGGADLGTPVGYLSAEMYSFFMPAVLLVFAIGRSTSTLAGEEEDHTLDLLLAQPIRRTALYVQKVVGVALGIAVLAIAVAVPVIALADWSELKVPAANLWAATAQLFAFVLFLGMLAMTAVGPTRRALALKTFFNMLGPLVNPSSPKNHMLGTFNLEVARLYNYILQEEGDNYAIIHALDGYDEISLTGAFKVYTKLGEKLVTPSDLGMNPVDPSAIFGGNNVPEAAQIFKFILSGEGTDAQNNVVLTNAAFALQIVDSKLPFSDAFETAKDSLFGGKAKQCLEKLVEK